MKKMSLSSLATFVENKYKFVKTALLTDVLLDCLAEMDRYLNEPMYHDWYGDPETQEKVKKVKHAIVDLHNHISKDA